jgi:KaiC/GvpD/RAD55 family RecA-like ATPase
MEWSEEEQKSSEVLWGGEKSESQDVNFIDLPWDEEREKIEDHEEKAISETDIESDTVKHPLLKKLEKRSFDPTAPSKPIHFVVKRRDEFDTVHNVAREDNIILVKGKPGTRKSTFVRALLSGVYNDEYSMGFQFDLKGDVIFIDAEQDMATYQACQREFYKLAGWGLGEKSETYHPYILTPDTIEEKIALTELALQLHKNAKYIVIDQLAAFCQNYNDQTEAEFLTSKIKSWAFDYEVTPIIVMHTNFTTDKANGSLGSEAEKISNVAFWLVQEGDSTKVINTKIRGTKKLDDFYIYHDDEGLPTLKSAAPINWGP